MDWAVQHQRPRRKKYKRIRGDDGGNDTLDLNGVRDDGGGGAQRVLYTLDVNVVRDDGGSGT